MDAIECIKTRRSVRRYSDKPVPKEIVEDIIDCARLAPTANNLQPWEFVIVTDEQLRREIARIAEYGRFIAQSSVCIVVFCQDTKYYLEDGSAATENILLAAHAYGLATCWVAGDKKRYTDEIRALLKVPLGYRLISLISVGYPVGELTPKHKRTVKEVLHWDNW